MDVILNLRQLKAFQEVMLTGSVTKAAQNIGRTQPAISSLISSLEATIGYDLFERRAGRLHPVPEAHFLLEKTNAILKQVDMLTQTMQSVGSLKTGHLNISCMPVFSDKLMSGLISRFVLDRDKVTISLVTEASDDVYNSLASQQFEVGLAEIRPDSSLVNVDEIKMECVCAVASTDPLAKKAFITPADLDGRPMASFVQHHFVRQKVQQVFKAQGYHFNVRFEVQNSSSQYVFIENEQACAIMSPISAHNYVSTYQANSKISFIPFQPEIPYIIAIISPAHKPLSRLAQAFCELLKEEIETIIMINKEA